MLLARILTMSISQTQRMNREGMVHRCSRVGFSYKLYLEDLLNLIYSLVKATLMTQNLLTILKY